VKKVSSAEAGLAYQGHWDDHGSGQLILAVGKCLSVKGLFRVCYVCDRVARERCVFESMTLEAIGLRYKERGHFSIWVFVIGLLAFLF
jgi:hypothetical protein